MSPRKRAEIDRREQDILAGALALFTSDDWPAASMDQIAARAGVSKGTLYNHFASKDDVYARLLIDFSEQVLDRIEPLALTGEPPEQVSAILAVLWDAYRDHPHYRRISHYCEREGFAEALSATLHERIVQLDERLARLTTDILQQGVDQGRFRAASVAELGAAMQLVLAGLSRVVWNSPVSPAREDPLFASICSFLLAGLGAEHVSRG